MKLWGLSLAITAALIVGWTAHHANAGVQAGTYPCATVTTNASGWITAISSNPCVLITNNQLLLNSGGDIILYSGGRMLCNAC
jgi:hypothetical protein